MKKVTMRDIANELGISPSTVSRALSNSPGVSEELREIIRRKAREMGYIPNMVAKALKKSKSKTVGLIVPDMTNPFFIEFIDGLDSVFFSSGYKFIVGNTDENVDREKTYLEWFLSHGVDGIIAAPTDGTENNEKIYKRIIKMGIPLVLFDRTFSNLDGKVDCVCVDNERAIMDALEYLKSKGHRKVGILISRSGVYTMRRRKEAFLKGIEEFGMESKEEWILDGLFPERDAVEKIKTMLRDDKPSAVIAANQSLTRSFLKACKDLNVKIPNGISLIGFDDAIENEFYDPPITSIKQPAKEMGKISATFLLGRIEGDSSRPYKVILKTEIVERSSVSDMDKYSR